MMPVGNVRYDSIGSETCVRNNIFSATKGRGEERSRRVRPRTIKAIETARTAVVKGGKSCPERPAESM